MSNLHLCIFFVLAGIASSVVADNVLDTIFIRYYDRMGSELDTSLKDASSLVKLFDPTQEVVLVIHGFSDSVESESVVAITSALQNYTDANVLALDCRNITQGFYPNSVELATRASKAVAKALNEMVDAGLNPDKLHLIGHSLGAEMAGYISRNVNFQVQRITATDPAGPFFYITKDHVSANDAKFVLIIHTNMGFYGLGIPTGTVDFFPNYGHRGQPGCPSDYQPFADNDLCSHNRAWKFLAESIANPEAFVGIKCKDGIYFGNDRCDSNQLAIMGYYTPNNITGKYYLFTNAQSPFGRGKDGIMYDRNTLNKAVF